MSSFDGPRGTAFAPAKVNLALHVVGQRPDGYHELESLVAFCADTGDRIRLEPRTGGGDRLQVEGPFGGDIPCGADNLVLRAAEHARDILVGHGFTLPPLFIHLEKNLPVASGIGGGSADAAALLRLLIDFAPEGTAQDIARSAVTLGADVPMCIDNRAAVVKGIGELIEPVANGEALDTLPMLLINPRLPVSTPAVFKALTRRNNPPLPALPSGGFGDVRALCGWLAETRNDLQEAAETLVPEIADGCAWLIDAGALFARMSGSGATVFGLFESSAACRNAAKAISVDHPRWWVSIPPDCGLSARNEG